ncbi:transglycosylase SLT domain-containing protein [Marinospirillum sp. MEB164]|uniref:Transglycosylase SLT domain-containing protein n=1 Tax=Marinospirillum alkalitolerans TaxID=3123374 RepID=A0ABW8PXK1_9GAMM
MRNLLCLLLVIWSLPLFALSGHPGPLAPEWETLRSQFSASYQTLRRGALPDLERPLAELGDYPLAPYLEHQRLRNLLAYQRATPAELADFVERHPHTLMAQDLLQMAFDHAQEAHWPELIQLSRLHQQPLSRQQECRFLAAQAEPNWWQITRAHHLWQQGHPLPDACQFLTDFLQAHQLLRPQDYAQASLQLFSQGQRDAALRLAAHSTPEVLAFFQFWHQSWSSRSLPHLRTHLLEAAPESLDAGWHFAEWADQLLAQRLSHHLRQSPDTTLALADALAAQGRLSAARHAQLQQQQAITYAASAASEALVLFAQIPPSYLEAAGWQWYARTLLRHEHWEAFIQVVTSMPEDLQQQSEWRYWLATAYQQLDQPALALPLYANLARERHYYGFLAARDLGLTPRMNDRTPLPDPLQLQHLMDNPGLQRSHELFQLGYLHEARREWFFTVHQFPAEQRLQAAWLAQFWGWYELSARTANAVDPHALQLRFPLGHLQDLQLLAAQHQIDPALVLALIRKESIFSPDARSSAGALGLMQVMPRTGQQVARQMRLGTRSAPDLLDPQINLPIGVFYLSQLLERFQQQPALAAAAYNAGPNRTQRWVAELGSEITPLWVERITYGETRDYVKSLLAFQEVYRWLLEQQPQSLLAYRLQLGTSDE